MKPIDTLLFDLDGTLVDIDTRGLARAFLSLAAPHLRGLMPPWRYYFAARDAIRTLKTHNSDETNYEVMLQVFARHASTDVGAIAERVRGFEADFVRMRPRFRPVPGARETLLAARDWGYRLGLATNPSTPLSLVRNRLEWGGLGDIHFDFVTHSENMTRSKPSMAYYAEILHRWDLDPGTCLMIGNDPDKDLPAGELGIRTFLLVRDLSPYRGPYRPHRQGGYDELRGWLADNARSLASPIDA